MSKKKALELISASDDEINAYLDIVGVEEFRKLLRLAIKEQGRDTRHACADAINDPDNIHQDPDAICINCRGGLPDLIK